MEDGDLERSGEEFLAYIKILKQTLQRNVMRIALLV